MLRLPLAYLLADKLGPPEGDGLPAPAPYTRNAMEQGRLVHYLDIEQLARDPHGLGRLAADGHALMVDGRRLPAAVEVIRLYPATNQPPFATLAEARRALDPHAALYPPGQAAGYVGDTVLDVALRYRTPRLVERYTLASSLDPGLPGQDDTANLIVDHGGTQTLVVRVRGLMAEPVTVSRSALAAALSFVRGGLNHILEGPDHLLFVLCLTLAAPGLTPLVWRVTGFTVGHSVTLVGGFFGVLPTAAWFIPAVETGIALSIIYAATAALEPDDSAHNPLATAALTAAMGLLHGAGFSLLLRDRLALDAPQLWPSLLGFNIGIELGQLAVVVLVWPAFRLAARCRRRAAQAGRRAAALGCIAVAAYWSVQRGTALWQTLT